MNMDWEAEAQRILSSLVARKGLSLKELAAKLDALGIDENNVNLSKKINRGKFSFAFFLQCTVALEVDEIRHGIGSSAIQGSGTNSPDSVK